MKLVIQDLKQKQTTESGLKNEDKLDEGNKPPLEETLIKAVFERRALWDPTVHFYRNKAVVKTLWEEVAEETGLSDLQVRSRWKTLRDYYRIELKKMKKANGNSVKKSNWIYYKSMSFLHNLLIPETPQDLRKVKNDLIEDVPKVKDSPIDDSSDVDENIPEKENDVCIIKKEEENGDQNESCERHVERNNSSQTSNRPSDNTRHESDSSDSNQKFSHISSLLRMKTSLEMVHRKQMFQLENRRLELLERAAKAEEDDDLLFFKSLLPIIRTLPHHRKAMLRLKFQEIVCEELLDLRKDAKQ